MKKWIISIIVLALLAGCAQSSAQPTATPTAAPKKSGASGGASAQGYVTPIRHADLAFRAGGRAAQVLVKEGDQVKTGQPLIKLQDADLKATLAQAQADLARLQAGARPEEIAAAQANVDVANSQIKAAEIEVKRAQSGAQYVADISTAQAQLTQAQNQLKTVQDSYDNILNAMDTLKSYGRGGGSLKPYEQQTRVQLDAAKAGVDAAQKRVAQARAAGGDDRDAAQARLSTAIGQRNAAQAQLDLLKAGSTAEQIEAAKARVAQAQAALDETTLLAPFDGTIAELNINVGENVAPGTPIVSIADLAQWQVETDDLSEVDVVNVQPGAEASITVDALPGVTLKGQVKSIVPRSAVKRGDVTYTVKVAIADPDPRLKWGMTAFVDVRGK